jgi:RES domain-containing protein
MKELVVYRISKSEIRANDLSGTGAFLAGGRWNSIGKYMLYTSANSSLAYLETLVHFNEASEVPKLFVTAIKLPENMVYKVPDQDYPKMWLLPDDIETQIAGDRWMLDQVYLGFKVRSAINPLEFNFLLNPLFPGFHDLIKIESVTSLNIDTRLLR